MNDVPWDIEDGMMIILRLEGEKKSRTVQLDKVGKFSLSYYLPNGTVRIIRFKDIDYIRRSILDHFSEVP